jgi:hypothetical protein
MQTHQSPTTTNDQRKRAEAHAKARELLKADAAQAMQDYRTAQNAVVERTRRLRAERLAREAKEAKAAAKAAKAKSKGTQRA